MKDVMGLIYTGENDDFGLKLFVEVFQWWPTVSYVIISVICVTFSYLTNKFYSFRKAK